MAHTKLTKEVFEGGVLKTLDDVDAELLQERTASVGAEQIGGGESDQIERLRNIVQAARPAINNNRRRNGQRRI